jgi:hypothetical protein
MMISGSSSPAAPVASSRTIALTGRSPKALRPVPSSDVNVARAETPSHVTSNTWPGTAVWPAGAAAL